MLSVWWPETQQGSSAFLVCWTLSSQELQLGSCHTGDFLLLHHTGPLSQLSPGAWQQHFLMPKKWKQTIHRYLHLENLQHHRTRVKAFNNSSACINSYKHPLLCSGNRRMSQKSADCQRLFHREFSATLILCLVSFWGNWSNHKMIQFQATPLPRSAKLMATHPCNIHMLWNYCQPGGCWSTADQTLPQRVH